MSKQVIRLRFHGPAVDDHSMDVVHLGPALFAVGELCKLANRKFNEDQANVRVLARADQETHCFEVTLEVFQSLFASVQALIAKPTVRDTKEILEWLGLIGGLSGVGLLGLLAFLKGRSAKTTIVSQEGENNIQVTIEGDGATVTVNPRVWALAQDRDVRQRAADVVKPLSEDGYESIDVEETPERVQTIRKDDAFAIMACAGAAYDEESILNEPQEFTAWITVYGPVYDPSAPRWRFKFGERVEYMDISETTIAKDAIERGGALLSDAYRARIVLVQSLTSSGTIRNRYSIVSVEEFRPACCNRNMNSIGCRSRIDLNIFL